MLVEICWGRSSIVVKVEKHVEETRRALPFESRATHWKEEVYFSTPITIDETKLVSHVARGHVYYWPPERSMCIFYGVSQPYTPVAYLGTLIDPVTRAKAIPDGASLRVDKHSPDPSLSDIVEALRDMGYECATPLDEGARIVTCFKELATRVSYIAPGRLSIAMYPESYGMYIETEPLFRYASTVFDRMVLEILSTEIQDRVEPSIARLDLDEEGNVVVSACISSQRELGEAIDEVEKVFSVAGSTLTAVVKRISSAPLA